MTFIFCLRLSTYKLDKAVSAKDSTSLDKKIANLVRAKEKIEKRGNQYSFVEPITKEDLAKLNFSEDLTQLKAIQRERESKQKEQVLSELTAALDTKVNQLESTNAQLQVEKKHSEELNQSLKITLKKLSDAEIQLKIERDWLAEQVEKKSIEVLKTIDQLIKE